MNATCRLLVEGSEGTDQLSEVLLASKVKPPPVKLPPDPVLEKFVRQIGGHATSVCLRAVLLWLTWHRTEAHAAVLLGPGCHGRSCKSARRRAVVLWLAWWCSVEARAAVLLRCLWQPRLKGLFLGTACGARERPAALAEARGGRRHWRGQTA